MPPTPTPGTPADGESQRMAMALHDSEGRFRLVLDSMSEGLMLFDARENLIYQNPASLRIHGFTPERATLSHEQLPVTWKAWDEAGRPITFEEWPVSRVFRGERFQDQVLRVVRVETGQEFYGSYNGSPIIDDSGKLVLGFITIRDITQQVRAKEALVRNERRLRAFFDSDLMGAIYWNMDGQITDANGKFLRMVGYSHEEVVSGEMSWQQMTPPEFRLLDEHALEELRSTGVDTPYEKEYIRKDGVRVPILIGAAMLDERGREGVAFVLDITDRKRAEQAEAAMQEQLRRHAATLEHTVAERTARLRDTVAELEHFSYTITHDMRAPLRAMQAFGQILRDEYQDRLDALGADYLRRIVEAAARMDSLITDALSYSKAVQTELTLEPVDPGSLVRGIIESYPQFHPPRAHVDVAGDLPAVLANPAGLTQCVSNLLGNAVKFVAPGDTPQVRVRAEIQGSRVRLWFEDNGIGIPPDQQERVFLMFQRVSKAYEGTGVGLALVRKVIEKMRGSVGVESAVGHGSRFWLELERPPQL